jgi:energy-coupling factor transporter ATP-binding protein EcfA2
MSPPDGAAEVRRIIAEAEEVQPEHGLELRRVSDIAARPVRWLWPGRIAQGKATILAGHPGLGKSQLALAIVAIVTTGGRWPVDGARAECGSAVILSAEDDPEDTIRPRLDAAGADLARCHVIGAVCDRRGGGRDTRRGFSIVEDVPRLAMALAEIGDTAIVVIDPITAYLGSIDSHRNAEVRAVLAPLAELAGQHGVAMLAISHLRKSLAGDAVLQVTGSLAFAAAARAVYIVARDPDNAARRLFLPAKNNLGEDRTGYAYRIQSSALTGDIVTSRIAWEPETVTMTADEALAPRAAEAAPRPRDMAAEWLRGVLADGPVAVSDIQVGAKAAGLSWTTVRRAADHLGTTTEKTAYAAGWAWRLPEVATPGEEIEL